MSFLESIDSLGDKYSDKILLYEAASLSRRPSSIQLKYPFTQFKALFLSTTIDGSSSFGLSTYYLPVSDLLKTGGRFTMGNDDDAVTYATINNDKIINFSYAQFSFVIFKIIGFK